MGAMVTWAGNVLLNAGEGVYSGYKPGMPSRVWKFDRMARSIREIPKDLGGQGADHKLTITYLNVPAAAVQAKFEFLRNLTNPTSGTPAMGSLQVAGYLTSPYCVFVNAEPSEQARRALAETLYQGQQPAAYYDLEFVCTFHQTG